MGAFRHLFRREEHVSIGSFASWRLADRTPVAALTEAWQALAPEGVEVIETICPPKVPLPIPALRRALVPLGSDSKEIAEGVFEIARPSTVRIMVSDDELIFEPTGSKLEKAIRTDYQRNCAAHSSDSLSNWIGRVLQIRLDGVQLHPRLFFLPAESVYNWIVLARILEQANSENYTTTVTTVLDMQLTSSVFRALRDEISTVLRRESKRSRIRLLKQKILRYEDRFQLKAVDLRRRLQVAA